MKNNKLVKVSISDVWQSMYKLQEENSVGNNFMEIKEIAKLGNYNVLLNYIRTKYNWNIAMDELYIWFYVQNS